VTLQARSWKADLARLAVVLIFFAAILAIKLALDWDENARQSMLRNVDNGVALGSLAAQAIGDYVLRQGRNPPGLGDLPAKIESTPMAIVALSPQGGEAVITLTNKRFGIDGKRMYFRPEIANGKVQRVVCRTDDEAFRKRIEGRCD
jgi:hypothetical protein